MLFVYLESNFILDITSFKYSMICKQGARLSRDKQTWEKSMCNLILSGWITAGVNANLHKSERSFTDAGAGRVKMDRTLFIAMFVRHNWAVVPVNEDSHSSFVFIIGCNIITASVILTHISIAQRGVNLSVFKSSYFLLWLAHQYLKRSTPVSQHPL